MKKIIILTTTALVALLLLSVTKAKAFSAHVSPHVSSHVSVHSSPHISSRSSVKSFRTGKSISGKSTKAPSSHTAPTTKSIKVGGEKVLKDTSNHTIKNSTSRTTYKDSFYNEYQPHIYQGPSLFTWLWWSNLFHHETEVSKVSGKVISKDKGYKLTIDDKKLGDVQFGLMSNN